ncbi:GNAT family N-acetyltransferase [Streptomyces sp. TLI_185]|uniref:GNAT family N-acetyltransferase n=1 Tax=Streptomyces sp. TLI_185 TaxID=2485151 RepID=UPI000F4EF363|nr:GNAT family N-acetyltransferase [Streptomyces sp. TLI_185]RPF30376.1 acetyltransferase (GNAT) family protein [Streptomyces sp. TLI_185]
MRFRWDWLRPVVLAPYVPTIGPVHPSVLTEDLFTDTLIAASTERWFLRYDKDIRWSETKDEVVLVEDIVHRPGETLIPTLSQRGNGLVKVHLYGIEPESVAAATELAQKLAAEHGAAKARIVRFLGPEAPDGRGTRIQLQDFRTAVCPAPDGPVRPFHEWPADVRETFASFADDLAADGFAFLYHQMQAGTVGPVLTAVLDGKVAGAIGPMEIRPDAIGTPQLMPQYFGVLPGHRGQGLGRQLWRAAMYWGQVNGAAYQLLQTEVGGPSDRLCHSEGLRSLGFTYCETT